MSYIAIHTTTNNHYRSKGANKIAKKLNISPNTIYKYTNTNIEYKGYLFYKVYDIPNKSGGKR